MIPYPIQTLADIGRFNHEFRTGFFRNQKKIKSILPLDKQQVKIAYIKFGEKFKMITKIIYVDETDGLIFYINSLLKIMLTSIYW